MNRLFMQMPAHVHRNQNTTLDMVLIHCGYIWGFMQEQYFLFIHMFLSSFYENIAHSNIASWIIFKTKHCDFTDLQISISQSRPIQNMVSLEIYYIRYGTSSKKYKQVKALKISIEIFIFSHFQEFRLHKICPYWSLSSLRINYKPNYKPCDLL